MTVYLTQKRYTRRCLNSSFDLRHSEFPCSARLRLSQAQGGRVRGRLFLARVSAPRHQAGDEPRVLAEETGSQQDPRPAGDAHAPAGGLARAAHLGARTGEEEPRPAGGALAPVLECTGVTKHCRGRIQEHGRAFETMEEGEV